MDSSALLEETNELEMDNPREGQEELNLNELNSFLNSIMNKCRSWKAASLALRHSLPTAKT